jgi:hypothetical protein
MSLINDALKKAQKLQTPQPASTPSPAPAGARPGPVRADPRRPQPGGFERMLVGLAALAVLLIAVAIGTVLLLRNGETPVVAAAPRPAIPAQAAPVRPTRSPSVTASAAPQVNPPPAAATVSTHQPQPAVATVSAAPPPPPAASEPVSIVAVSPPPAVASSASAGPAPAGAAASLPDSAPSGSSAPPTVSVDVNPAPAPATVETPPPAPRPVVSRPPAPPRQDPRILVFIDKLKVLGIRAAGSDSKVLMSGRVYRLNDIVDYELGLRLTGVGTTTLTFLDESGVVYTKSL